MSTILTRRAVIFGAAAVGTAAASTAASSKVGTPPDAQPQAQRRFTATTALYASLAYMESNPARLETLVRNRGRDLREIVGARGEFQNWICTTDKVMPTRDGRRVVVVLTLVGRAGARTFLSNLTEDASFTEAAKVTEVFRTLTVDDAVLVSGSFDLEDRRGFAGAILTPVKDDFVVPNFLVRFSDASQPAWLQDLSQRSRSR